MYCGGNSGDTILSLDMELSLAIIQKGVLITELRTLIAEHANNQCEWVNQQMSTIVVRTTAEVLRLWRLVFQRSFLEKETTTMKIAKKLNGSTQAH